MKTVLQNYVIYQGMSDMLLAKPKLPPGFIDCSVGEPYIIRDNLIETFQLSEEPAFGALPMREFVYPYPNGYEPLVQLLEEKHKAPIVVTNGAKQALGAVFYALKKMGKSTLGLKVPYWALIPPLVKMHGLDWVGAEPEQLNKFDSYLLLSPNNPDGHTDSPNRLVELAQDAKDKHIPFIHDAAYYTHIYLPRTHTLPVIGDVQIYSISKMLGLSGLRLGYAVCHNLEMYKYIQEYMEAMTMGVSHVSQAWLFDLMFHAFQRHEGLYDQFETNCAIDLERNKNLFLQISPEVLQVPKNLPSIPGMFGWFKPGPKCDWAKAQINVIDGGPFGMPGYVRMNLALRTEKIKEIVDRLKI
jgi:aspartate/methionine/tyrosine aminotransferase